MVRKPLGQVLKDMGLVDDARIREALRIQAEKGGLIGEILVGLGAVTPQEVALALAAQGGMAVVDFEEFEDDA